jgi:hypothetical protein
MPMALDSFSPTPPDAAPLAGVLAGMGGGALGGVAPPEPAPPPMLHNVTVVRRKSYGCARTDPVPPEEFGITRRAKLGDKATWDYCYHETRQTEAALISQGFDPDQVADLPTADFDSSEEAQSRDTVDDRDGGAGGPGLNPSTRQIKTTEHYILMKYEDDDKTPKLYRVTTAGEGQEILYRRKGKKRRPAIEPVAENPFDAMTPVIMPHRFFGRSVADLVMDLQRIRTALLRTLLDNLYLASNARMEVAEEVATNDTLDDMLANRPGGIVRVKRLGGIQPIQNGEIGSFAYPLLEYTSQRMEQRTGVTRQGQGIDAQALTNQSATAVNQIFSVAQAKVKLIARIFAETGIKGLFLTLHGVIRRNASVASTVRLRRKWVEVDPRQWKRRADMTVTVGMGSGTKEQQLAFLWALLGVQKEAIMVPGQGLVKPENIYNTLKKLVELGGLKSVDPYFVDPAENPDVGGEPPPDPKLLEAQEKLKLQQEETKAKIALQVEQSKVDQQAAMMKLASEKEIARARLEAEVAMKREQMMAEIGLSRERMLAEAQLKREQMDLEARTKLGTAAIDGAMSRVGESSGIETVQMGGEVG